MTRPTNLERLLAPVLHDVAQQLDPCDGTTDHEPAGFDCTDDGFVVRCRCGKMTQVSHQDAHRLRRA